MWRKKKLIIGVLVAALVICGSLGGIAYAQGNDDDSQSNSLLARVAEILGIDQQKVEDAFSQAREEMQQEHQDTFFQKLIDEGLITEDEAAEYETWLESRPDIGEFRQDMQEWFELQPELPDGAGSKVFRFFRGRTESGIPFERCLPNQ